ncbi:sigma-54-dependent Fis family transcriptional regulator [Pedobacter sp. KBW06]|uniref:sigma-54-dependent transcriptional regulator n=1 Tax=Pedobacter sp. KBW06 TaxID=2153359 RepID=UPI000F5A22D7|nr:sigma-54 dependent transcriptional regulator [Pedobacter sp. KBW06]RQO69945.1 sigma-54-dependent Fis family transcriptional regulator [Pedobacter sp. KBW06]
MQLKNRSILVVDDDPDVLTAVRLLLNTEVGEVVTEKNPEQLPSLLSARHFDLILLDMNFKSAINNGNEGFFWLNKIKAMAADTRVIMITAYGDIDLAIQSLKNGASDFVVKPWHNEKLLNTISEALDKKEKTKTKVLDNSQGISSDLIGKSDVMQDIFYKISRIAPTDANILILGENGTGKDLIAKAIHQQSLRAKKPFVKVDIGSLTEGLFESELFGHKKGAYTDAREDRTGRFEAADTGTLFLDEIGNISLQQQAKLLSVLQNRQVTRIGSNDAVPVDIRLICATNVEIRELASDDRFRKDLIYRINTVEIIVPPLRKRGKDVLLLARHFAKVYADKYFKSPVDFEESAMDKLLQYSFPGNVRELQYTIERAVIMAEGTVLKDSDLVFSPIETVIPVHEDLSLKSLEKNAILQVIERNRGNITWAAKELGITRNALYRRLSKYDI